MAGRSNEQTDGSTPAEAPGRAASIRGRLVGAGLNRNLAAAAAAPLVTAFVTLWLVIPTLAPGVYPGAAGGDTAEFQTVMWVLGTAHPTGYPAFVILGFLASHLLPFGDAAYRTNLLQAFLGAGAAAGLAAIVTLLTGRRWIALATGVLIVAMPSYSPTMITFPNSGFTSTPALWRLSTYADPHVFHMALASLLFLLLLVWERRRSDPDPGRRGRADRWLVAAAVIFGVAYANHSLTLMLAPAVGLFVLAVAPMILSQWRLVLTCLAVLGATVGILFLELPIRAAMHAPQIYAHPDTLSGFLYVVTGQQFGGIPATVGDDLGEKYALVMNLMASWLGPLGFVAVLGVGTSLVRRPRYVLLAGLAAIVTCTFSAAYANSDIERYFLVPLLVAYSFVGLGFADGLELCGWLVGAAQDRLAGRLSASSGPAADPSPTTEPAAEERPWGRQTLLLVEIVAAIALIAAGITVVPARQEPASAVAPGAVSHADDDSKGIWMRSVLAPPDQGGLPENSVVVSNWSASTTLWYGQRVEGLRPDVYVVDDRTRLDNNLGEVWDVVDRYLGKRPVFLLRVPWNRDGMDNLRTIYNMRDFPLTNGGTIPEVTSKKGTP